LVSPSFAPPVAVARTAPPPAPPASQARLVSPTQTDGALALAEPLRMPEPMPEPEPVAAIDLAPVVTPDLAPVVTPVPPSVITEAPHIAVWRSILALVKKERPAIAATLELAAPNVVSRERIVLGFEPSSFEDGRAGESDARTVLAEVAKAFFGGDAPDVTFDVTARGAKAASVASLDAAKRKAAVVEARSAVERHPLVQKAIAIFDAELKDIRLPAQED
jgi:hypothetical protein